MEKRILITGITGYIGFQTLVLALDRGYRVRGIVRSDANVADLMTKSPLIMSSHEEGRLDFAIIPDFLQPGALDGVLEGITAIVHLASPLAYGIDGDFENTVVKPAVSMVTVVLEAAAKAPSVRRIVITSSSVTLVPFEWNMSPNSEKLYTVEDINSDLEGPFEDAMSAYWASKALARAAARDFVKQHRPDFDIVQLLPSVVIGRDDRIPAGGDLDILLQGTRKAVLAPALDESLNSPFPYVGVPVHVADVARAHVDAVNTQRIPGNTEFILSSDTPEGVVWDRDIPGIARKYFPGKVQDGSLALQGSLPCVKFRLDGMTTESTFGWKFTSFQETMKGLIEQYIQLKEGAQMGTTAEKKLACNTCGAKFGYRTSVVPRFCSPDKWMSDESVFVESSLVRHQRKTCNQSQSLVLRRKSCSQCVRKKRRCSLERPICERCHEQGEECSYEAAQAPPTLPVVPSVTTTIESGALTYSLASLSSPFHNDQSSLSSSALFLPDTTDEGLGYHPLQDFDNSLQHFDHIQRGNVNNPGSTFGSLLQPPRDAPSDLARHSMELVLRVLRTWPGMLAEEFQLPPIFHYTQHNTPPLLLPMSHCVTLTKMWHGQGQGSVRIVHNALIAATELLLEEFHTYDEATQASALQALVIYTIIILSPGKGWTRSTAVDTTIFQRLRILVQGVVVNDLLLPEEKEHGRPSWTSWIQVTVKRRTILSLYLLHWAFSVFHGVPSYDCAELAFMPGPAAKALWQATTEHEWEGLYTKWLARWGGRPFLQGEFWGVAPGVVMNDRAERWLAEADEFGFIMAGILNATEYKMPTYPGWR
ncbi:hypothetical protein S7711_07884 [Stachybotrys chartarum IBT 7711]|uniref:Zn(2)-C6 fungal-type domain-containing protein n=1 Tax=Stachybotrys chartarum (strain CBS 109288 / IBT 7711) TaxID=1280523 RepID=A0A084AK06_STACB|nr:hypothetical protein S7711_07884 [Stachybotrys chartarum IBT 7711]